MLKPAESPETVTVMVFKDNYAPKTFQLPLNWIPKIGLALGILTTVGILTSIMAVKNYRLAAKAQPSQVRVLEQELSELKLLLAGKPSSLVPPPATPVTSSPAGDALDGAKSPAVDSYALAPLIIANRAKTEPSPPVKLNPIQVSWNGKTLLVRSSLQYTQEDGGKLNGSILILTKTKSAFFVHPSAALNLNPTGPLINASEGEPFQVSRFREIQAEVGPIEIRSDLKEVRVLILNDAGNLIVEEALTQFLPLPGPQQKNPTEAKSH